MRYLLLGLIFLASIGTVAAMEPQTRHMTPIVSVESVDYESRTYVLSCHPPEEGYSEQRNWVVRIADGVIYDSLTGAHETWEITLEDGEMYHLNCGMFNQTPEGEQYIEGDHHIDLRSGPNTDKPNIEIISTEARSVTAKCTSPTADNYNLYWYFNHQANNIQLTEFTNQETISTTAPSYGLWDLSCGVWDLDRSEWTQTGLTLEFFEEGPAYVPNELGCMPWECNETPTNDTVDDPVNETGDNETNTSDGGSEEEEPDGACYASVADMPATCSAGVFTTDEMNGCRTLICNGLEVLACDKPGSYEPTHFEMYKQSDVSGVEICLGETCISNNGYVRSADFPLCTTDSDTEPEDDSEDNSDETSEEPASGDVTITMQPWWPQGTHAVLVCEADGATSYDWDFGDGQYQYGRSVEDVYHIFPSEGDYDVTCTAYIDGVSATSEPLLVSI